jgi:small subunit ribosomal protein S13
MADKGEKDDFRYIVRIAGTDIDGGKKVPYGLSKIKGIGLRTGEVLCAVTGIDPKRKIGYLTDEEVKKLDKAVSSLGELKLPSWLLNRRKDFATGRDYHVIGSDLAMALREDLNRLRKIRSYRGIRHELGLPVRGQRTRTSFRKGVTVGVTRRKSRQEGRK